jgi:hypothetical protein
VTEDTSEPAQRPIPFELPEYDKAFAEFIYETANALVLANSPLLREIPRMSSPGTGSSVVDARDFEQIDLPEQAVGFGLTFDLASVRNGDFEPLIIGLNDGSDELARSLMEMVVGTVGRVTEATGNVVATRGEITFEAIYKALDSMEWSLTEDDELSLPTLVMHPDTAKKLPSLTPEQELAMNSLKARKLEELLARRRSRRLS